MNRKLLLLAKSLVLLLLAGSTGCGYSSVRPFRTDIQTIHVEMLHSREFRRELEFRLTEAISKRLVMDTPYRLSRRDTADAILSGEILSVKNRTFGDVFDTNLPREIGTTVVIRFRLQDMRSGDILVDKPRFVHQSSYIPTLGETFTQGMTRALEGLAERVIETMELGW